MDFYLFFRTGNTIGLSWASWVGGYDVSGRLRSVWIVPGTYNGED